ARARGLGEDLGCARARFSHRKLRAEPLGQPLTDQARGDVGGAAGGKADDQTHRPRRIILRAGETRDSRQRGSARGQMQEFAAGKFYFELPFTSFDHLVGAGEERRWHSNATRIGGVFIYYHVVKGWACERGISAG